METEIISDRKTRVRSSHSYTIYGLGRDFYQGTLYWCKLGSIKYDKTSGLYYFKNRLFVIGISHKTLDKINTRLNILNKGLEDGN